MRGQRLPQLGLDACYSPSRSIVEVTLWCGVSPFPCPYTPDLPMKNQMPLTQGAILTVVRLFAGRML